MDRHARGGAGRRGAARGPSGDPDLPRIRLPGGHHGVGGRREGGPRLRGCDPATAPGRLDPGQRRRADPGRHARADAGGEDSHRGRRAQCGAAAVYLRPDEPQLRGHVRQLRLTGRHPDRGTGRRDRLRGRASGRRNDRGEDSAGPATGGSAARTRNDRHDRRTAAPAEPAGDPGLPAHPQPLRRLADRAAGADAYTATNAGRGDRAGAFAFPPARARLPMSSGSSSRSVSSMATAATATTLRFSVVSPTCRGTPWC